MTDTIPHSFNFTHDVMEQHALRNPDGLAMWWVDDSGRTHEKITFAHMATDARKAAAFFDSLGIRRGDRVLVILQRVPQWWYAMLGLIRLGAIPIPGTPLLTSKDIHYRVIAAGITTIITDELTAAKVEGFGGRKILVAGRLDGWTSFDEGVRRARADLPFEPTRATDPGIIFFTSGTTGDAKMVVHSHVSYGLAHKHTGHYWLDCKPGEMIWALADTGWGKTAWSSMFAPWNCGATVFVRDLRGKFDPALVLKTLEDHPITIFCAPATALRLLVRKDLSAHHFRHLRHCVSAGEAVNPPVAEAWKKGTGLDLYEAYGQTETICTVGNFRCEGHPIRPGSMGRAMPGFTLGVIDEEGNELPRGTPGQLAIRIKPERPLGMFLEYWKNPDETGSRFVGDWYCTGDSAIHDRDGYFWFVGRADDIINSASYRIGPSEVESALQEHPAVLESAAVGVPDEMRGEAVKAYIVLREGFEPGEHLVRELQAHCKRVTAPYKYPRRIEFVSELPKTISGKVRRVELRARHAAAHPPDAPGRDGASRGRP